MNNSKDATMRRYEILDAIRAFKKAKSFSPSMRDLINMTGLKSTSTISYYLDRLEADGLIRRTHGISRSIEITAPQPPYRLRRHPPICEEHENGGKDTKAAHNALRPRQRNLILTPDEESSTSKSLQARIDDIVANAKKNEGMGRDVIRDNHKFRLVPCGVKVG